MRAVLQRVKNASVKIDGNIVGEIQQGILILAGIGENDTKKEIEFMANKIANIRIFEDSDNKMNKSLLNINGDVLVIPNFTLYSDCSHGRRPYFSGGAKPKQANELYQYLLLKLKEENINSVQCGEFGADMKVSLLNDGPVTIILDTDELIKNS